MLRNELGPLRVSSSFISIGPRTQRPATTIEVGKAGAEATSNNPEPLALHRGPDTAIQQRKFVRCLQEVSFLRWEKQSHALRVCCLTKSGLAHFTTLTRERKK
jgi:hypothetical protein